MIHTVRVRIGSRDVSRRVEGEGKSPHKRNFPARAGTRTRSIDWGGDCAVGCADEAMKRSVSVVESGDVPPRVDAEWNGSLGQARASSRSIDGSSYRACGGSAHEAVTHIVCIYVESGDITSGVHAYGQGSAVANVCRCARNIDRCDRPSGRCSHKAVIRIV